MRKNPFVRSPYNYDVNVVSLETALDASDPDGGMGRAKQEFTEECDINTIVRRFNVTGQLPEGVRMPTYGDFSSVRDFHSAANAIAEAHEAFDAMPADVRRRFGNDPGRFVDFCSDPKNSAEAKALGLVPPGEPVVAAGGPVSGPAASPVAPPVPPAAPAGSGAPAPASTPST